MKKIKQQSEVYISILLGVFFVLLGIFVLFNTGHIRSGTAEVDESEIRTVFDLVNVFFLEGTTVLSMRIGEIPIISGILMIVCGGVMLQNERTHRQWSKYDQGRT